MSNALSYAASRYLIDPKEQSFAIKHAEMAYRTYKDYFYTLPGLRVVMEGYRFDDDNGLSVFMDYDGRIKAVTST